MNPSKRAKNTNSRCYTILHGCMNTRRGRAKYIYIWVLLDSGCSSMIVMRRLMPRLKKTKDDIMQWQGQAGNLLTNLKVKTYFILP